MLSGWGFLAIISQPAGYGLLDHYFGPNLRMLVNFSGKACCVKNMYAGVQMAGYKFL